MPEPIGPDAPDVTADAHRVAVEIDVSETTGRVEREALRLISDLSQQGLEGEALADAVSQGLGDLSDAPLRKTARGAVSEGFNLGRNLEAQERIEEIQEVVRVEVLDRDTCTEKRHGDGVARCFELDFSKSGTVYQVNSPEYFEFMPPNKCDGRIFCRGFMLYRRAA